MADNGVYVPGAMERYDAEVEHALGALQSQLSPARAGQARELLLQATALARAQLVAVQTGSRLSAAGAPVGIGQIGELPLSEMKTEDVEYPVVVGSRRPRLQIGLVNLIEDYHQ